MILYQTEAVFPPGQYVIGDPCYHVPEDMWDRVLNESDFFNMKGAGAGGNGKCFASFTKADGSTGVVVAFVTKYGDGEYKDEQGRKYGVDAGLIGIIPLADVDQFDERLAHIVQFDTHVRCFEQNGTIVFGNVYIDTNDAGDEDEIDDLHGDY